MNERELAARVAELEQALARRAEDEALQDALFNVAYVAAVAAAATVVPADGRSVGLAVAAAGVYAVGLLGHLALSRRTS